METHLLCGNAMNLIAWTAQEDKQITQQEFKTHLKYNVRQIQLCLEAEISAVPKFEISAAACFASSLLLQEH